MPRFAHGITIKGNRNIVNISMVDVRDATPTGVPGMLLALAGPALPGLTDGVEFLDGVKVTGSHNTVEVTLHKGETPCPTAPTVPSIPPLPPMHIPFGCPGAPGGPPGGGPHGDGHPSDGPGGGLGRPGAGSGGLGAGPGGGLGAGPGGAGPGGPGDGSGAGPGGGLGRPGAGPPGRGRGRGGAGAAQEPAPRKKPCCHRPVATDKPFSSVSMQPIVTELVGPAEPALVAIVVPAAAPPAPDADATPDDPDSEALEDDNDGAVQEHAQRKRRLSVV